MSSDSEAPEEFTAEEAMRQDEEIRRIRRENEARVAREKKERRRKWAQRFTPKPKPKKESTEEEPEEAETREELVDKKEMLPDEIVKFIATNQRKVFTSDSEDEKVEEKQPVIKKKKQKPFGSRIVDLKDVAPPPCVQNSLDFLQQRKTRVSRSSSVLNNSNQALRFLSSSGLLK